MIREFPSKFVNDNSENITTYALSKVKTNFCFVCDIMNTFVCLFYTIYIWKFTRRNTTKSGPNIEFTHNLIFLNVNLLKIH